MTDDICMGALTGSPRERAERAIAAGCDIVLHCNGVLDEMREVADAVPELDGEALRRTDAALASRQEAQEVDRAALERRFDHLLSRSNA